jgi:hypothetical protein
MPWRRARSWRTAVAGPNVRRGQCGDKKCARAIKCQKGLGPLYAWGCSSDKSAIVPQGRVFTHISRRGQWSKGSTACGYRNSQVQHRRLLDECVCVCTQASWGTGRRANRQAVPAAAITTVNEARAYSAAVGTRSFGLNPGRAQLLGANWRSKGVRCRSERPQGRVRQHPMSPRRAQASGAEVRVASGGFWGLELWVALLQPHHTVSLASSRRWHTQPPRGWHPPDGSLYDPCDITCKITREVTCKITCRPTAPPLAGSCRPLGAP